MNEFLVISFRTRWPESFNMTYEDKTEEWQRRMREVQGAIIVASIVQLVVGYCGIHDIL